MKFVLLFILLAIVGFSSGSYCPTYLPPRGDETCGFTRDDALKCIMDHVNTDGNDFISYDEVTAAIANYAPWYIRMLSWMINTKEVFDDCDYNNDSRITRRDWIMSKDTCLGDQASLCTFSMVLSLHNWRIKKNVNIVNKNNSLK